MVRTPLGAGVLLVVFGSLPGMTSAGSLADADVALRAAEAVHWSSACSTSYSQVDVNCCNYSPYWADNSGASFLYLIVGSAAARVGGVSLGIRYEHLGVEWTSCAGGHQLRNNDWPASCGGNAISWATCPTAESEYVANTPNGIQVLFGYFYIYGYGVDTRFEIIPNPGIEPLELAVFDCGFQKDALDISHAGVMGYGLQGYNPCCGDWWFPPPPPWDPDLCPHVPVVPDTWGSVKARFLDGYE